MQKFNWADVPASSDEFANPTPGGYICRIMAVEDCPERNYLKIYYDIVDGDFKDFYTQRKNNAGIEYPSMYRSYTEKARGMFKGFLKALEESNRNFIADKFDGNEQQFRGLFIGLVLAEEEYLNKNNEIRLAIKAVKCCSGPKIRQGDFKVPPLKKLSAEQAAKASTTSYTPFSGTNAAFDDECPF